MFSLRFGSFHVSISDCIYKILERKAKFNVELGLTRLVGAIAEWCKLVQCGAIDMDVERGLRTDNCR
jgi:hypothetical protein